MFAKSLFFGFVVDGCGTCVQSNGVGKRKL